MTVSHESHSEAQTTEGQKWQRIAVDLQLQVAELQAELRQLKEQRATAAPHEGLVAHDYFMSRLLQEIQASERYGRFLSVVIVSVYPEQDVDRLNPQRRDERQQQLLLELGNRINSSVRETDVVGTLDDHELGVMLIETEEDNAVRVVDRLREETADAGDIRWAVASYPNDAPRDDMLLTIARKRLQSAYHEKPNSLITGTETFQPEDN